MQGRRYVTKYKKYNHIKAYSADKLHNEPL